MNRVRVSDPEIIQVLMDFSKVRLLAHFTPEARTVAQAAGTTGQTQNALLYWIKKFVRMGLMQEVGEGRPAQYQAIACEYLIETTRLMPLENMIEEMYRPLWRRLMDSYTRECRRVSEDWYVKLTLTSEGLMTRREVAAWQLDEPHRSAPELPLNAWGLIRLPHEQAQELQNRLNTLIIEYLDKSSEDEQDDVYVFHLGFVRVTPVR
jgi:hypothetical protein